jgi:hypothetical protein
MQGTDFMPQIRNGEELIDGSVIFNELRAKYGYK